jgi:hypothetical protein
MKVQIWRNVIIQSKKRTMNDGFWRMNDFVVGTYMLLLDKNKAAYIFDGFQRFIILFLTTVLFVHKELIVSCDTLRVSIIIKSNKPSSLKIWFLLPLSVIHLY